MQTLTRELEAARAEAAEAKARVTDLEASVQQSAAQLEEARQSLDEAERAAAAATADQRDALANSDAEALERRLAEAQAQLEDASKALADTQKSAQDELEAMGKMHAVEIASAQEDHQNALRQRDENSAVALQQLQDKLIAIDEDRERLRHELEEAQKSALRSSQSLAGAVIDVDLKALHDAHVNKLAEVESAAKARETELQEVRRCFKPNFCF